MCSPFLARGSVSLFIFIFCLIQSTLFLKPQQLFWRSQWWPWIPSQKIALHLNVNGKQWYCIKTCFIICRVFVFRPKSLTSSANSFWVFLSFVKKLWINRRLEIELYLYSCPTLLILDEHVCFFLLTVLCEDFFFLHLVFFFSFQFRFLFSLNTFWQLSENRCKPVKLV